MTIAQPDKPAACLAVLGTGSDVGKSVVAALIPNLFDRQQLRFAGAFHAQIEVVDVDCCGMRCVGDEPVPIKPVSCRICCTCLTLCPAKGYGRGFRGHAWIAGAATA